MPWRSFCLTSSGGGLSWLPPAPGGPRHLSPLLPVVLWSCLRTAVVLLRVCPNPPATWLLLEILTMMAAKMLSPNTITFRCSRSEDVDVAFSLLQAAQKCPWSAGSLGCGLCCQQVGTEVGRWIMPPEPPVKMQLSWRSDSGFVRPWSRLNLNFWLKQLCDNEWIIIIIEAIFDNKNRKQIWEVRVRKPNPC